MMTVDTRGQLCPAPLIAAKRALREIAEGESIIILTDNSTSYSNLTRFLKDNKAEIIQEENNGVWKLTVKKTSGFSAKTRAEDYCRHEVAHFEKGDFVVVISSEKMGEGDDELGRLLVGNFIKALKDLDKLPAKIIFYNSGVKLAVRGSEQLEHLRQLEKMGVEILLCSTCVNHYGLEEKTDAGILSNMYTIAEAMASASKVIKP
ncbi:MAG TPA: sulfurtransferase-like selenium metabolism protein YedF [Bacteroidales bacterium]|nr:sulfurtransferase-like selenium metabolism protein YedF [Bacteroidales bacterium]